MYNVGYSYPYTIYMWDETEEPYDWKPQGQLQGAKGDTGEQGPQGPRGYTYTPHMDSSGNLSWTNDGQQVNPDTVNLKGPQGEQGPQGQKGQDGAQGRREILAQPVQLAQTEHPARMVGITPPLWMALVI